MILKSLRDVMTLQERIELENQVDESPANSKFFEQAIVGLYDGKMSITKPVIDRVTPSLSYATSNNDVAPGMTKAILKLSDGRVTGDCYFEVAHIEPHAGKAVPFKVSILSSDGKDRGEVEVLGTYFNIN